MHLKILLPFEIFAEKTDVLRIVAETREGSFGILPHRLDCVAHEIPRRNKRRSVGLLGKEIGKALNAALPKS